MLKLDENKDSIIQFKMKKVIKIPKKTYKKLKINR